MRPCWNTPMGAMKGILSVTDEPLVSTDLKGSTFSSIFSAMDTWSLRTW